MGNGFCIILQQEAMVILLIKLLLLDQSGYYTFYLAFKYIFPYRHFLIDTSVTNY